MGHTRTFFEIIWYNLYKGIDSLFKCYIERCPSAIGAFIDYFSEGNYAIIVLMLEETYGSQLGEYFYYDNTYIQSINTHGSLESITYYK